ncbi:nitrogen regulation protein NR(I) [Algiphilus sp.]|uniref:nitrogen regulation protein NR(I) n=1 Tax=Algiphilus sp. TaxID=1872431 RepID=UPI0025BD0890|nr:nitrogen regulation protein NR(I) [Algiphilus sp.]MCK5770554.1 nitrogen regulation protein NR(I) [Algiphilus sp.]
MNDSSLTVWVVDDDESIRWVLERSLSRHGMTVESFPGAAEMLDRLAEATPDVLISDIRMPGVDGLELLQRLHEHDPDLPVIIMTAHSDLDAAVAAYKGGAFEYLAKPFDVDDVSELVQRAAAARSVEPASQELGQSSSLIGEAPAMQDVFRAIGRLSQSQITVLITGETGVGKELVARALHNHSPRAGREFIAVNTAAIPRDLMESEFFGHERGAFTGAQTQRRGRFEQADGGTLFLDEIGDMPLDLQTRLLRVLSDGEFYRVGGTTPIKVDVRVIAATNQELEDAVAEGRFREDLFHRLNVIRIRIPSLRERTEDIPMLARHFLITAARDLHTEPKRLSDAASNCMQQLSWPGNVRQLENICRWLTVMAPGQEIQADDLPPELRHPRTRSEAPGQPTEATPGDIAAVAEDWPSLLRAWADAELGAGRSDLLEEALPAFERTLIEAALANTRGHRIDAAKRLGWGRNTLTRKIKELNMEAHRHS